MAADVKTELAKIAERCENAPGPDRELDGLIEVARDPMRETIFYNEPGPFPQKAARGPIKDLALSGRDLADYIGAPAYTASLDAAMTLVGEADYRLQRDYRGYRAIVWVEGGRNVGYDAEAVTAELSLCAAALKARAASGTPTRRAETLGSVGEADGGPTAAPGGGDARTPVSAVKKGR